MIQKVIDAHIHFDMYSEEEREQMLQELDSHQVTSLIAVSYHLSSAEKNLALSQLDERVKPAFGFHPEQSLPTENHLEALHRFIQKHQGKMIAVGEVGLPYYLRKENNAVSIEPYLEALEQFIQLSVKVNKPIVLHAIYEDAPLVCNLLEKYSVKKAHFHWFKGDAKTMERMEENGYSLSITPDVLYEKEIQQLVQRYPLTKMMAETDGPWPFEGPFNGKRTHPSMLHQTIPKIAQLKGVKTATVYQQLYDNTTRFYELAETSGHLS